MRFNITQPDDWLEAWTNAAEKADKTLSEWIGLQCNAALPKGVQKKLTERKRPGQYERPKR